jgi:hypothetical protein
MRKFIQFCIINFMINLRFVGDIFSLSAVTKRTSMLASQVGVCTVTRPEPMVCSFALIQDGFWLVANKPGSLAHPSMI